MGRNSVTVCSLLSASLASCITIKVVLVSNNKIQPTQQFSQNCVLESNVISMINNSLYNSCLLFVGVETGLKAFTSNIKEKLFSINALAEHPSKCSFALIFNTCCFQLQYKFSIDTR